MKSFHDYFHPIFQLVIFLIVSDCSFRKRVVPRGILSPVVVLVFCVGNYVVLRVHILTLKVGPFIFHSTTLVLSQCTTYLPSLWLPFILFLVLISGVRRSLFPNIFCQNHQLPRSNLLVDCCVAIFWGWFFKGGIYAFLVHTFPLLHLHIFIYFVIFMRDYIFYKFLWYH